MKEGIAFIALMVAGIATFIWFQVQHFKDLTPAESEGASCYMRSGAKGVASCLAICDVKFPNDPGCKAQVIKDYEGWR
jgi:hypothetical protein